jgi:VCBS repeat-containing protein
VVGTVVASDPDFNQSLSFAITAGNTSGAFAINAASGTLSVANTNAVNYLINPEFNLTVTVTDNGSPVLSSQAQVNIFVTPANTPPVIANQSFSVSENSPAGSSVGQVVASDPDPGQSLSYAILSGNTGNTFAISTSGLLSVASPTLLDFENPVSFSLLVQVTDNGVPVLASSTMVTITVTDVNEAPGVEEGQAFTVAEHVPAGTQVGTVEAADPDQGQTLTFSIVGGNTNNAFAINTASGLITVAGVVCYENCGHYNLLVRSSDNASSPLFDEQVVAIDLTDVNENPQIAEQDFAVASYSANGTVVGTVVAADPDFNQSLSFAITAGNTSGAFAINAASGTLSVANTNAVNYLINPEFNLTVTVTDNGSPVLSSQAQVNIFVTPANTPPVIANQSFSVSENSPAGSSVGQVVASDPDPGQSLSYAILSGNTGNTFAISASGLLSVASPALLDFENPVSFSLLVQVTDNGVPVLASSTMVTITVTNVNEAPGVEEGQAFTVAEHVPAGTQVGTVVAADPDQGQTLSFSIVGGNTNNAFAINTASGLITVAGVVCYESNNHYYLVVRAEDNALPSLGDEQLVDILISDINESPVVNDAQITVESYAVNGTYVGTVVADDPDLNQSLSYNITSGNSGNAFTIGTGSGIITVANSEAVSYLTNPEFNLTVTVSDNGNPVLSAPAQIHILVQPSNTPPVINNQSFSVNENMPEGVIVGQVIAVEPDPGQTLTYSIVSGNTGNAFNLGNNGVLSIADASAINHEINASFSLLVMVTDNGIPALSAQSVVMVTINDLNEQPVAGEEETFSIEEHSATGTTVGTASATDPDNGQSLTYSIVSGNTENGFSIYPSTGEIIVAGNICFENNPSYTLTVRITDNGQPALWAEQLINIELLDINESPEILSQQFTSPSFAPSGTSLGIISASDPDYNQTLTFQITAGNTDEAFGINAVTGELYVNNSSALNILINQSFDLTIRVTDNGSPVLFAEALVTIILSDVNYAPVMANQEYTIPENQPAGTVIGTIVATDPNPGQSISFSIISGNIDNAFTLSSDGVLSVNNAEAINFEMNRMYTLLVLASDNGAPMLWSQAAITVFIQNVNDAPMMAPQKYSVKENTPNKRYVCKVIAKDEDQGDMLYFSIVGGNTNNAFSIQRTTGRIYVYNTKALDFETNPYFELVIRVSDNYGAYTEEVVTMVVLDVNEAPVVLSQTFTISEFVPDGTFVGQVEASDPDRIQTLRFAITQGNSAGIFEIGAYTGILTIANSMALNNSTETKFVLTVKVRDNGYPALSSNGYSTVTVFRNKETGEITAEENSERLNLKLKVYPNPSFDGMFNIQLEEETTEETTISITDLTGKPLREENFTASMNFRTDLSGLPRGAYLMFARNGNKTSVTKLIKQ